MEFYKDIYEEFPEAILIADASTGTIEFVNKEAENLFGYPREELIGMHQTELHPPEKRELYKKIFEMDSQIQKNYPGKRIARYKHKNLYIVNSKGQKIAVYIYSSILEYNNKKFVIGLFVPQKKNESKPKKEDIFLILLRKSEELYHQGSFVVDLRHKTIKDNPFILISNKTKQLLGIKKNITRIGELIKLVIDEQKESFRRTFYSIVDDILNDNSISERVYQNEYIIEVQNQLRYFMFDYIAFSDRYLVCLIKDITEKKQQEELLLKKANFLRILSEARKVFFYSTEESILLKEICKILVEEGKYVMAFVGLKKNDPQKIIEILTFYSKNKDLINWISQYNVSWDENSVYKHFAENQAIREAQYKVINDIYFDKSYNELYPLCVKYSIEAYISLPILIDKKDYGVLNIYSEFPNAFQKEEIEFLNELIQTISYAILFLIERKNKIRLMEQNIQLSLIFDNTNLGLIIIGLDGNIIYTNRRFEEMSGYVLNEIIGQNINILKSGLHDREFYQQIWSQLVKEKREWKGEIVNKRKDGSFFLCRVFISPSRDIKGEITHFVQIVEDLTLERYYEEMIEKTRMIDSLTNLPNRNSFLEKLNFLIRLNEVFYLIYLDIYHFSRISHLYGYLVSDQLLQMFTESLKEFISQTKNPQNFFVARLGNDEFAILVSNIFIEEVILFTENLLNFLKKDYYINKEKFVLNTCAGIAIFPANAKTAEEMLRIAELALTRAIEEKGIGNFALISDSYESYIKEKIKIESALQELVLLLESKKESAIDLGLEVCFQPIFELSTGKLYSLEALLRWKHPKLGPIPPSKFVPIAEENQNLIIIGEFVLEKVFQKIKYWKENHFLVVPVSINISYIQLKYLRFIENLVRLINKYQIDTSLIEFEITESSLLKEDIFLSNVMEEIRKMKIKLLLDDFGTGYSSLSYLLKFNFDYIKIDKFFIDNLLAQNGQKFQALSLIRSIVNLSRSLNIKVIAEGIENYHQKEILLEENVDLGQGFLFAKPMSSEELENFLLLK